MCNYFEILPLATVMSFEGFFFFLFLALVTFFFLSAKQNHFGNIGNTG